jgi:hypothetical protein
MKGETLNKIWLGYDYKGATPFLVFEIFAQWQNNPIWTWSLFWNHAPNVHENLISFF